MSRTHERLYDGPRAQIRFRKIWCKSCGICAAFCPTHALEMKDERLLIDVDKCTGCGLCELRCPDFAILVSKKTKLRKINLESPASEGESA